MFFSNLLIASLAWSSTMGICDLVFSTILSMARILALGAVRPQGQFIVEILGFLLNRAIS